MMTLPVLHPITNKIYYFRQSPSKWVTIEIFVVNIINWYKYVQLTINSPINVSLGVNLHGQHVPYGCLI